jgi:hypothetical protein
LTVLRPLAAAFALLFLLAAALQYNDPDPIQWMAIYLAACASCLTTVRGRTDWRLATATAAVSLLWALALMPHAWDMPLLQLLGDWGMSDPRVERAREMYGLLLVFAVCAAFGRQQWSARRAAELIKTTDRDAPT